VLHPSLNDLDAIVQAGRRHSPARPLDVDGYRLDADARDVVRLDQPDEMRAVPAARIQDHRAGRQVLIRSLVEPIRAAWVEAAIELPVDAPGLLAVNPRQLAEVAAAG